MEFPRAAPSGIPQASLGFRGHLITNFPHIMVLLIIVTWSVALKICTHNNDSISIVHVVLHRLHLYTNNTPSLGEFYQTINYYVQVN